MSMAEVLTRRGRAEQVAFWRYQIIREAADASLAPSQRGRLVREVAAQRHPGPFGGTVQVSRTSLDRWIRAWRAGGLEALAPKPRQAQAQTPKETLDLAARLKQEAPERTAAQVKRIIEQMCGAAPSESTLLRHFRRLHLPVASREVFGRFEADFVNEIWVGDFLHGPRIAGRKTYLAAFMDDHSRYVVAARWAFAEDTARLSLALRPALLAWGLPAMCYTDNGASFRDRQFARACARLGIRMVHSQPRRPQGRGKIERFFNTVSSQFLTEVNTADPAGPGTWVASVEDLGRLFRAWLETSYHQAPNATTGEPPAERWARGWARLEPRRADPAKIDEAFLWSQERTVTRSGTVQLFGNTYQVDPLLAGRRIEAVYDPFDLSKPITVFDRDGRPAGNGALVEAKRHVDRKALGAARDAAAQVGPPASLTGVDYLRALAEDRKHQAARAGLDYTALAGPPNPRPGRGDGPDEDDGWEQGVLV
jgi:putative transposase